MMKAKRRGRLYVRYFNFAYACSGTLFEGRWTPRSLRKLDNYTDPIS